jgi:hypothetical protein
LEAGIDVGALLFDAARTGPISQWSDYGYAGYRRDHNGSCIESQGFFGSGYTGGSMNVTTVDWIVPTNVSLGLRLSLTASSYFDVVSGDQGIAGVNAMHSLSLPLSGPVFTLPAGYMANSVSYGIVDNQFTPVPEPGHYTAAAAVGLLGFGFWRRSRLA